MAFPSDLEIEVAFNNDIDETMYAQTGWTSVLPFVSSFSGTLRGRGYELDRTEAGTLSVLLDNVDGRFLPGSVQSPYYPYVKSDRRFRIRGKNMVHPNVARGGSRDRSLTGFVVPASANFTAKAVAFDDVRVITASAEPNAGQGKENIHDGTATTKWSINTAAGWIQYQFPLGIRVLSYTLTSALDIPAADPSAWTLKGSNDGTNFTTLHTVTGNSFTDRSETQTFTVTSPGTYLYYRLDITANQSGTVTQLAEWDIFINYADVLNADLSHYVEVQLNANRPISSWYDTVGWYIPLEYGVRLAHSAYIWRISGTEPTGAAYQIHATYLDKDLNQVGETTSVVSTGNPKTHTLAEDWRVFEADRFPSSANVTAIGGNSSHHGRMRMTLPAVGSTARVNTGANRYDMTNSQLAVEFAVLPTHATATSCVMARKSISPEYLVFLGVEAGNLLMRKVENGVVSDTTTPYDPVLHRWLRLRHDGTNVHWETATNGMAWVDRRTPTTTTVDLTDVEVTIESQWLGTAGASNIAEIGWFNKVPTSRLPSSNLTAFGTLRTINDSYTDKADDEYAAGMRVGMYEVFWDRAEGAANGTFSSAYGTQITNETTTIRNLGMKLTLGLGLPYPPSWTSTLTNARMVNESAVTNATVLNYVFSQAVRDEAEDYIDWVHSRVGFQNCHAIRINVGSGGELLYPSGGLWGYDTAAQGGANRPVTIRACPHPGWTPGTGTTAQAAAWYEWYLDALADAARWQMAYIRAKGFTGWFEIITPGVGTLAAGLATEITNRLSGYSATTGVGAVWHKVYARLSGPGVVAYCSSVGDNSGSPTNNVSQAGDTTVAITSSTMSTWSAARILARVGKEFCAGESGENPGWGGFGEFNPTYYAGTSSTGLMAKSLDQAEASPYIAFYWAHAMELYNGNFPSGLSTYQSQVNTQNGGSFPSPPSPPTEAPIQGPVSYVDPAFQVTAPTSQTLGQISFAHTPPASAKYGIVEFAIFIPSTTNSTALVYGVTGIQSELLDNLAPDISGFRDTFNWQIESEGTPGIPTGVGTDPTTSYLSTVWGTQDSNLFITIPHLIPGEWYTATVEAQKVGTQPNLLFSGTEGETGALISTTTMTQYTTSFEATQPEQELRFILQGTPTATEGLRLRKLNVQKGANLTLSLPTSAIISAATAWIRPKDIFEGWVESWPAVAGSNEMTITVVDRLKRVGEIELANTLRESLLVDKPALLLPLSDSMIDTPGRFSQLGYWGDVQGGPTYVDIKRSRGDIGAATYTTETDDGPTGEASLLLNGISGTLGYFLAIPYSKDFTAPTTPVATIPKPKPTAPVLTVYTKKWYATWSRSYDSSGATRFDDSAYMYQGAFPGGPANQRSLAGFDYKNIMATLKGAEILECYITVTNEHARWNKGLYAWVGTHNYSTKPSTWSGATVIERRWKKWVGEGASITVDSGAAVGRTFRDGTQKGIAIGPESDGNHYGYFRGATMTGRPVVTIKYRK